MNLGNGKRITYCDEHDRLCHWCQIKLHYCVLLDSGALQCFDGWTTMHCLNLCYCNTVCYCTLMHCNVPIVEVQFTAATCATDYCVQLYSDALQCSDSWSTIHSVKLLHFCVLLYSAAMFRWLKYNPPSSNLSLVLTCWLAHANIWHVDWYNIFSLPMFSFWTDHVWIWAMGRKYQTLMNMIDCVTGAK